MKYELNTLLPDVDFLNDFVRAALNAGATDVDARSGAGVRLEAGIRNGQSDGVTHSETSSLNLTAFVGKQMASVGFDRWQGLQIKDVAERVVAMARAAPANPYGGLPEVTETASGDDDFLKLRDPSEPDHSLLAEMARECEEAALTEIGSGISDSFGASWSISQGLHVTSRGVLRRQSGSLFGLSAGLIATGDDGERQIANRSKAARWREDLPNARELGIEAAAAAKAKLKSRRVPSGKAAIIFDRKSATQLIAPFVSAINGHALAQGYSFLADYLDKQVFSTNVTIVDDPFVPRGLGSIAADLEGIVPKKREIVANGILTTWLLDTGSARQLGLTSTGHSGGPYNLSVAAGEFTPTELRGQAGTGLIVTEMFSPSLNPYNGDWSAGISGFWFEDGEVVHAVNEVTIGGNLRDIYANLIVGSDLQFESQWNAPSILVASMAIGGE